MSSRRARGPGRIHARWRELRASRSYAFVLVLIVASFVFTASSPDASWSRGVLVLIESATLAVALWTSRVGPVGLPMALPAIGVAVAAAELAVGGSTLRTVSGVLSGVFVVLITVVIARGVVSEGAVNAQSVLGAICIYLLLGMLYVFVYGLAASLGSGFFFTQGTDGTPALRLYFSFVTLTTVGYGDYSAADDLGHTLAVSEALIGQLYLVTVVAVLVARMRPMRARQTRDGGD